MKSLTLRSSVALACALSLAGCGGGDGNLVLGGYVYGLTRDGLVLQNNGGPDLPVPANATSFQFQELLHSDEEFNVTLKAWPKSAKCEVGNGKGKTGGFSVTTVTVTCTTFTHALKGQITGLGDATGLALVNGSDRVDVAAGKEDFTMVQVADGSPYGVTILAQPAGRTCTVLNGVGTMGEVDVTNIQVKCVTP
jgi:hypothetical protein